MNKLVSSLGNMAGLFAPWLLFASIAALCWFLASTVWLAIAPPKAHQLELVSLQPRQSTVNVSGGIFSVFEAPKAAKPVSQPVVNTNFKLEGVFIASTREMSAALINANGKIRRYRVGTTLEETNYQLVDVSWDQALLEDSSGGQIELSLHDEFNLNAGAQKNASSSSNNRVSSRSAQFSSSSMKATRPKSALGSSKRSAKEQMNDMFETAVSELQSNPAGYLSKMGVMATGDGYEVTSGMNSQVRNNIGLKPGDKVISVNGQSVGQPQQDAQLLAEIQQTGSAEIQVQRGSQVITVRQQF